MSINEDKHAYTRYSSPAQFAIILAPFALFFDAAILFRGRLNLTVPAVTVILFALNGALLFLAALSSLRFFSYRKLMKESQPGDRQTRRKKLLSYLPVTVVASVFSALAAFQFNEIPRFDAGLYYDSLITATETFTYTLDSFASSFALWTHPMQGTSLLIGIGEMLFPKQSIGVYWVTLIVTLAAIFCLYGIMGRIFPDKAPWLKAAGTAVFAFCPYVLGLFSHLSADYFSLMFFVILIYTFTEELDYLAAFMSLLLIFSKETGILFAASFLIPAILIRAGKTEGTHYLIKMKRYLLPKRLLVYSVGPLALLCYSLFSEGLTFGDATTNQTPFRWDNNGIHCFGANIYYISARLAQAIYMNFFWITTILFVAVICAYFFRRSRNKVMELTDKSADSAVIAGIVLSSLVYLVFSCLFITIMCPRYNVSFALPASVISVWAISYIWKKEAVVKIMMGGLILILLLQNYANVDPSISLGHQKLDLGYQYIYSPTKYGNLDYLNEMYVYNRTFAYAEDLLDQAMEKINPDESDYFLTVDADWYEIYLIGDPIQTDHLIYWDSVDMRRTYESTGAGIFLPKLSSVSSSDLLSDKELKLAGDFYFFISARKDGDAYCAALEARGYAVMDSFVVKNYLGYLTVYHMAFTGIGSV